MVETKTVHKQDHITVGAGIAIAAIWLANMAATIIMLMINFVWEAPAGQVNGTDATVILLITASPMIVAYYVTKMILGKDTYY